MSLLFSEQDIYLYEGKDIFISALMHYNMLLYSIASCLRNIGVYCVGLHGCQ